MNKDKYVQILNPKPKRYTLINKTTGIVVGTKRDDKPFSNVEIIEPTDHNLISPSGRKVAKSDPPPQNMPGSIAQHTSRVLNQSKTPIVFDELASIYCTLGEVMESIPDVVLLKNKISEWGGSMYKKCPVKWCKGLGKTKTPDAVVISPNGETIYIDIKVTNPPESPFGDAVNRAMMIEKSEADKAYDKFKKDERDHTAKLKVVLIRLNDIGAPATAHDLKTSMVIMWELLQKEYIEDVTPATRTGGAVSPDTTYCYKITSKGRVFSTRYGI